MNGILHVETTGTGPPLILLHGWAMHSGVWGTIVAQLAQRFRVHAVDLPGHGRSAPAASYALDALTRSIATRFGGERETLTLLGWSLGGLLALRWASLQPGRIARLVLVGSTPCFVTRDDWPHAMAAGTLARFGDELRVAYRLTLLRFLSLQLQGIDNGRAVLARLRRNLVERGAPAPAATRAAAGCRRDSWRFPPAAPPSGQ